MSVRTGQSVTMPFTTRAPGGGRQNADTLPTATLYLNGVASAATVTVTNISTGLYNFQVTMPALVIGDVVAVVVVATVSAVTENCRVWHDTGDIVLETGTAQAGGASTITLRAGAVASTNYWANQSVYIAGGTGAGQTNKIVSNAGLVCTVETPWVTQPDSTSIYLVLGRIG